MTLADTLRDVNVPLEIEDERRPHKAPLDVQQQKPQKAISLSREARSENRRMLNALGEDCFDSNLLQFNTLKFR